ncbi:hypothetical protein JKF63_05775 [Porcisia hertigi]|uniref:Calponin-homology (CH) domain-containing protein n=1 Tax=Porcisia hertigi TaxID=2761500 RepID=A0A836I841_9TRYP|nr:hypothetical protein JKF63_05775 [Porcisia hertigi]
MQREVIKWVQSLDLSAPIQNPKRDLATGHLAAEIVAHYTGTKYLDLHRLPNGVASATKCDVWSQVYRALQQVGCKSVTQPLIDAVLRREPNAALTVLEYLYEHFTSHKLSMRGLDAVGTSKNAYVQPQNCASTAMLLRVADGKSNRIFDPSLEGEISNETGTALSPTSAVLLNGAGRGGAAADALSSAIQDAMADESEAFGADSRGLSTRALQHRLALIDNDELAGGANALQAYPRYARHTASTLVHTASGSRKDVVLDRPKYTSDEILQRQQNKCILQQHAVVQKLQGEADGAIRGNPSRTRSGTSTWTSSPSSLSPPLPGNVALPANKDVPATVSLATLYRGRFYRQPDSLTSTGAAKGTTGSANVKKGKQGEAGSRTRRGAPASSSKNHLTVIEDKPLYNTAAATGDPPPKSELVGGVNGSGGTGGPRLMPKLRVTVQTASIQAALAQRSTGWDLQERAAELSREHFAKHNYSLRPALGEILADVLSAHKQLQRLFDCCVEDGSSEVLDNVLSHLLAHQDEFSPSCVQACWQALTQHVDGIVAILQRDPEEYAYLIESLAFAFTRKAAEVRLLHVSQSVTVSCEVDDAQPEGESPCTARIESCAETVTRRRSTAASSGPLGGAGDSAASANSNGSTRRRQGLDEAPLTATQRAASLAVGSCDASYAGSAPLGRPRAIIDTRDGLPLACAFGFLYHVARQLDVRTAAYLLERYVLRITKPFLLRHGTVAVREAVARVVSASFVPTTRKTHHASADTEIIDGEAEKAFVQFLSGTLARALLGSAPTVPDHDGDAASKSCADKIPHSVTICDANPSAPPPLALHLQRTYWLVFLHAVAEYPRVTDYGATLFADAKGLLATCVRRGAIACLSSTDVDLLTIGVGLTIEYSERWLPRDASPNGTAEEDTVAAALDLFSHVLPSLNDTAGEPSIPWWKTHAPNTWECRLMVLRLCIALLDHPFFHGAVPRRASADVRGDCTETASHTWRSTIDAAAAECLLTFDNASSWQLQLALGLAAKSVDQTSAPALTDAWCKLLFSIPSTSLLVQLVPYDERTVRQRLLHPLQSAAVARERAESWDSKGAQRHARPQQGLTAPSPNEPAPLSVSTSIAGAGQPESWTLTPAMDRGGYSCTAGSSAAAEAAVHFLCGRVLSVYAAIPLNQTWYAEGVVDALLPPLTDSDVTDVTSPPPEAPVVQPALPLLVMAAALLSPPSSTTTVAAVRSMASRYRLLSISPADGNQAEMERPSSTFWLSALRRAWPLLKACGVSQEPAVHRAHTDPIESQLDFEGREAVASPRAASTTLNSAAVGLSLEDLNTIVLSIFLRVADADAVASATVAAAGDDARLCRIAIQWAETTLSEMCPLLCHKKE